MRALSPSSAPMTNGVARQFAGWVSFALMLSCASLPPAPSPSRAAQPIAAASATSASTPARARLRVGTSGDYAPFSVRDASGALHGFDVEIADALATDLGLEV